MLEVLLHSRIGILSIVTVTGGIALLAFWLIYISTHMPKK